MLSSSFSQALSAIVAPSPRAASNVTGPVSLSDSHVSVVGRRVSCDRAVESVTFAMRGGASIVVNVDDVAGAAVLPSDDGDAPPGEPVLLVQGCVAEGSTGADSTHMSATGARAVRFVFKNADLEPVEVVLAEVAAVTLAKRKEPHATRPKFASLRGVALAALAVAVLVAFSYLGTDKTANDTLGNSNATVGNRELGANLFATGDTCPLTWDAPPPGDACACTLLGDVCAYILPSTSSTTCVQTDSCLGATGEISGGHSCTGSGSCYDARDLKITGGHSCTEFRSCESTINLKITGGHSCTEFRSCESTINLKITGGHSCTESDSCTGARDLKITRGHSCTGAGSCMDSDSLTISGAGSCSGKLSCRGVYGASGSTIGQDSCSGENSCRYLSDSTVGHRSCTGASSCRKAKQISIGNFACTEDDGCRDSEVNIPDNCRSLQELNEENCNKWWNHLSTGCFNKLKQQPSPMTRSTPASCAKTCDKSSDCKGIQVDLNTNTCGEVRAADLMLPRGLTTNCPEKLLYLKSP